MQLAKKELREVMQDSKQEFRSRCYDTFKIHVSVQIFIVNETVGIINNGDIILVAPELNIFALQSTSRVLHNLKDLKTDNVKIIGWMSKPIDLKDFMYD